MVPATCRRCSVAFEASRRGVKYCSAYCRDQFHAETHRADKSRRAREYGYRKFDWKPRPTEPIACANCSSSFLPKTSWGRCCTRQCGARLRYRENPEKYLEKSKRTRQKTHAEWKARGRATWAEMKAQRGTFSRFAKARQPWSSIFTGVRHRALAKNIPFDLTREWCEARWTGHCELTGIKFALNTTKRDGFAPSIDKINPNKGYVQSNCRFVLWAFNLFKFTGTDETMYALARVLIATADRKDLLPAPVEHSSNIQESVDQIPRRKNELHSDFVVP